MIVKYISSKVKLPEGWAGPRKELRDRALTKKIEELKLGESLVEKVTFFNFNIALREPRSHFSTGTSSSMKIVSDGGHM